MMFRPRESHDLKLLSTKLDASRPTPLVFAGCTMYSIIPSLSLNSMVPLRNFASKAS